MNKIFVRNFKTFSVLKCEKKTSKVKQLLEEAATFDDVKSEIKNEWSTLPYPEGVVFPNRDQAKKAVRPSIDPRETSIILFPGQGSQYVGMGQDLLKFPKAREIFELGNEVLKYDLLKICLEGPKTLLDKTVHCQPAVMITSLAALEKLKEERPFAIKNCKVTAGFSLGEITALVFAGAIPFDKAVKLVQIRAEAMQKASEMYPSGMATVLYGPDSQIGFACKRAKEWCLEKGIENPICEIANYLYPHCKVIGGNLEALKYLELNMKTFKLRRIKRLAVSGAFHTKLMESAVEPFSKALKKIEIQEPIISVHSNVNGKSYNSVSQILHQLPKQIVRPVKWEQLLHVLYERGQNEHFPRTFECGPGKGLTTILKQVNLKAFNSAYNVVA